MSGNKRIYFACLGVAYCGGTPIVGAKSVGMSFSRNISNIFAPQNKNPIATYGNLPDIEVSFSSYMTGFSSIVNEVGLNSFTGIDILAGPDINKCIVPDQMTRLSYLLLTSIVYNMPAQGFFSVERTYKGWNKNSCTVPGGGAFSGCNSENAQPIEGDVYTRQYFSLSGSNLPNEIRDNPLDNVTVSASINRQFVQEFATRKPYASYVSFPIETSCTFDFTCQKLDNYTFDLTSSACKNAPSYKTNIKIALCNGSIDINDAYLTSFKYSGAGSDDSSNLKLSVTYTGYTSPSGISPVLILPDEFNDPCTCP